MPAKKPSSIEIRHTTLFVSQSYGGETGPKTPGAFETYKPVRNGLFDPRMGPTHKRHACGTCAKIGPACMGHFGHIKLAVPLWGYQRLPVPPPASRMFSVDSKGRRVYGPITMQLADIININNKVRKKLDAEVGCAGLVLQLKEGVSMFLFMMFVAHAATNPHEN